MLLILFLLIISKIICQFLLGIISILLQELAFPLSCIHRLANPFVPLLCGLISITARTSTLLIPGGWVQTWWKSLHIPGDQQSDTGLHWATTWPIDSGVFGEKPGSSWLLYVSTKGIEKSFWYGYLVKEIKRFPFALILFMFSARKLNLNRTSSCRCSGTWSEKHLFGATAEEKWPRFMKSWLGWTAGTDKDYLRSVRQRRAEAGCRSSAGPGQQLLWAGFRVALLYSSPHGWFIYPLLSSFIHCSVHCFLTSTGLL